MAEHEENRCVAVTDAVALLGDKWMLMIYGVLGRRESIRYTELQRAVPGISQRILTLRLKTLAKNGLVKRTVFATVPPRVDYELTALGRGLLQPLRSLVHWMRENREELVDARRTYGSTNQRGL